MEVYQVGNFGILYEDIWEVRAAQPGEEVISCFATMSKLYPVKWIIKKQLPYTTERSVTIDTRTGALILLGDA